MRFVLVFALAAFAAQPVLADKKQEVCNGFANLTDQAVTLRKSGLYNKRKAVKELNKTAGDLEALTKEIVKWVWSLPKEQLTSEVAEAARAQCT